MLSDWFANLDFPNRMALISISLGVLLTLGVFLMARRMVGSPPSKKSQPLPENTNADDEHRHDPFVYGCPSEKRIGLRRKGNTTDVMIKYAENDAPPWFAIVMDRSVGGLRLLQENVVPAGTILSVRPGRCSASTSWTQIEVRHCRKSSDGWELGCSFIRTPASTLLMDFG